MSDPLRVALVAEGPTDRIVIEAAVSRILGERTYILKQLQPEESVAFGPLGTGQLFKTFADPLSDIQRTLLDLLEIPVSAYTPMKP